ARLGGAPAAEIRIRRSADMRYGEQVFEIQVSLDGLDVDARDVTAQVAARFHRRHEELYTCSSSDQDVVLVNARVAVIGVLAALPEEPAVAGEGALAPRGSRPLHLGRWVGAPGGGLRIRLGRWISAPVYDLGALGPDHDLKGPAIFESATTTVLIREDERAR